MLARFNRLLLSNYRFATHASAPFATDEPIEVGQFPKPAKHFKQLEYNPWQAIHLVKTHAVSSFD